MTLRGVLVCKSSSLDFENKKITISETPFFTTEDKQADFKYLHSLPPMPSPGLQAVAARRCGAGEGGQGGEIM